MRLLILLLISSSAYGQDGLHVLAGGYFGVLGASTGAAAFDHEKGALIGGIGLATFAGTIREVKGARVPQGKFDVKDLGYTMLGGAITSTIIYYAWRKLTYGGNSRRLKKIRNRNRPNYPGQLIADGN